MKEFKIRIGVKSSDNQVFTLDLEDDSINDISSRIRRLYLGQANDGLFEINGKSEGGSNIILCLPILNILFIEIIRTNE